MDIEKALVRLKLGGILFAVAENNFFFPFEKRKISTLELRAKLIQKGCSTDEANAGIKIYENWRFMPTFSWLRSKACHYLLTRSKKWNIKLDDLLEESE